MPACASEVTKGHAERVRVGRDLQPAVAEAAEELGPEVRGLRVAERHPEDLPTSFAADSGGHDEGLREDMAADPHVEVGGVQEQVREPDMIQRTGEELVHGLSDLPADPGDRGAGDAGVVAQCPDELVDLAGAHPVDPGLADHRVERLVDPPARSEQAREERPFPQLRNRQVNLAGRSCERLGPGAVAAGDPFRGALVRGGADLHRGFRVDQILQPGLQHPTEHVRVGQLRVGENFCDQGRQGRLVVGHRGISSLLLGGNRLVIPR
jgi:hypothetical protein